MTVRQCIIVFHPLARYGRRSGNLSPLSPWVRNCMPKCVFGCSFDFWISVKLPSKKPRLLQTETVGNPGLRVAVRLTIKIKVGKRPHRKVPIVPKAKQNASPHSLIRWTSSMHANKIFARKVRCSKTSLHSLLRRCSGSTQTTCHLIDSLISPAKQIPAFHAALRVSLQYENAEIFSFDSS